MEETKIIDVTGAELKPGNPDECEGNGKHAAFEICCDECDYFLQCFPEWVYPDGEAWQKEKKES